MGEELMPLAPLEKPHQGDFPAGALLELKGGAMPEGKSWWQSKRLWVTLSSLLVIILNDALGLKLPEDRIVEMVALVAAYVLGQSYEDAKVRSAAMIVKASDAQRPPSGPTP